MGEHALNREIGLAGIRGPENGCYGARGRKTHGDSSRLRVGWNEVLGGSWFVRRAQFTSSGVPGTGMIDIQQWADAGFRCKRNTPKNLRYAIFFSADGSMN
jgi:hypothetical protein